MPRSAFESAHSDPAILCLSIYSAVCIGTVTGQQRPISDCAFAQSDLGLRCPHMLQGPFSRVTSLIIDIV